MNKICGFYISSVHMVTMMLPYLKEMIKNEIKFETFFEYDLSENINKVLSNLTVNNNDKNKILDINWKDSKLKKYTDIEKELKDILKNNKNVNILISGSNKYIEEINKMLNKFFNKYGYNNITIINCYEVSEFDDNIRDILDLHEYILNTSGIHKIEDIFEDYKRKKAN